MLTRSKTMAVPEATGEIARMERVSDTPYPSTPRCRDCAESRSHTTACITVQAAPQNLTYSLHEAGGGNDWWNRFQPSVEVQSILGTPVGKCRL